MNSPSSMSLRVCDVAPERCPRCSVPRNTIIFVFGCGVLQAPRFPSLGVASGGHCSPNFCVDHSYSGFVFIHFSPFPPEPSPLGVTAQQREEQVPSGAGCGFRVEGQRPWGRGHGIGYCWTFKTKAVVKISFLLLFLTRHFSLLMPCF